MIIILTDKTEKLFLEIAEKQGLGLQACLERMIDTAAEQCEFQRPARLFGIAGFDARLYNALRWGPLNEDKYWDSEIRRDAYWNATVRDLAKLGKGHLYALRSVGKKAVDYAQALCAQHGYELED